MVYSDQISLNDRATFVLDKLVRHYIDDGVPVGSRTLSKIPALGLSSATIRNVMADLEESGYIHSPHTSSGRIPTAKGYRFFINNLIKADSFDNISYEEMSGRFKRVADPLSILVNATEMLSQITSFAGILSTPDVSSTCIRQIEFIQLSKNRVLAILVTEDGQVQNKVLSTEIEYTSSELIEAANFFNHKYSSKCISVVRRKLLVLMQKDQKQMRREMSTAIKMASKLLEQDTKTSEDVLISGESNLLSISDFTEVNRLKTLFETFRTKKILLDLLQNSLAESGITIFIGEESGIEPLRDCSLISAPYKQDNQIVGVLGVIGPTRMHYEEVINTVDITAQIVSDALSMQVSV
ncbi:MAG: heat-inducible transcriptional repressor HrcA [Gammaproteobacteria bacterium]|nr:heat-inducible transcriptional repressor HrcA [Gammaproteobacteria bacterium]MCY4219136.1 heat-inducible transcriptional repressor HrcA [Gammaproteobacteria bacterium]MCY4275027.1 heat-inducible transcriptional repressor HrcA [Gammaproteobacteria bacterium]